MKEETLKQYEDEKSKCPEGMVYIPAGKFVMGDDQGREDEKPVHEVFLDSYYIDKYPVTNAQYMEFCNKTNHQYPAQLLRKVKKKEVRELTTLFGKKKKVVETEVEEHFLPVELENHPVVNVSWEDADAYAKWVGKRLPTEAEWEKAAKGGIFFDGDRLAKVANPNSRRRYPWGNEFDEGKCNNNSMGTTQVGKYPGGASSYGVMDMAGNVCEWVNDWYDSGYYSTSPTNDPPGPSSGTSRVLRGGFWVSYYPEYLRASYRHRYIPTFRSNFLGFRCVRDAK